ncbi:hypothetical protein [Rhizobium sp. BK377]|jgi:hypothetical protein|uniref:hypothetical protein n=1 Tax=Rhizobium sp. BK377 TaxID=2587058 RepID=UPI001612E2EE|nr:hypothetical protein [Rhizobium sp. BK377]MBB3465286.1 hypothetical protein [Rhizobium sp. BK377]
MVLSARRAQPEQLAYNVEERHAGVGEGKRIAGTIIQVSQAEVARGGTFFDFVTVEGDDGQVYKIRRLIAGSDVNPDIVIGRHLTMHIQSSELSTLGS